MKTSLKPSVFSGLVLAFSSFGDAFLYISLPVYAVGMNVPVIWIGFLLSVNRFVRLVANQLFARLFQQFGFRRITMMAAGVSVLTTFAYGFAPGLMVWIAARVTWGFCYSALRISSISYSLQNRRQGFSLGLNKALQELGPIIALVIGPSLLEWSNPATTFLIFGIASVGGIIISFYLPDLNDATSQRFSVNLIPSSFDFTTFVTSFFVQGILIVTLSGLIKGPHVSLITLAAITGGYLAYRRVCTLFISPFGGILADKYGIDKVFLTSVLFTGLGFLFIAMGFIKAGILTAFTFNSITAALAPGRSPVSGISRLKTVAVNSTWSDIGAAAGALVAGTFLLSRDLTGIFYLAAFILLTGCIIHLKG
jgi:DHA1 family multidrug resistance protein-like MFS transporter